jgi:hypothetical protein
MVMVYLKTNPPLRMLCNSPVPACSYCRASGIYRRALRGKECITVFEGPSLFKRLAWQFKTKFQDIN